MDDAKKEIEEALGKVSAFLEVADPVADIVLAVLEHVTETGISTKAGKIVDTVVGEIGSILRPLKDRWDALQKDRIQFLADRVKEMTGEEELEEGTAIEILKIHKMSIITDANHLRATWWESQAKNLQHRLEASTAAEKTSSTVLNSLRVAMPWKR